MIGLTKKKENNNTKLDRLLVNENGYNVWGLENKLSKGQPIVNELIEELAKAEVVMDKPRKLNPELIYNISKDDIERYVEAVKQYYIDGSGLVAKWLTDDEKLETTKKADSIKRIQELFKQVTLLQIHLNNDLKKVYIDEIVKAYVYHPDSIKLAQRVSKLIKELIDLGINERAVRFMFKEYVASLQNSEFINTKIDYMAGVKLDDELHSNNMRSKALRS